MNDDGVTIAREDLQLLYDLAIGSLDFGSGFWDIDDVEMAHRIAEVLGVDKVTPSLPRKQVPHKARPAAWAPKMCALCSRDVIDQIHQERAGASEMSPTIPVSSLTITGVLPPAVQEIVDDAEPIIATMKRILGHSDHVSWSAEDNFRIISCGCGVELWRKP